MKTKPRKVLIIKTGFSEFLDRGVSTTVSLGDVLICTSLLHLFKNDKVTWVTSFAAHELLQNNPYIKNLLIFNGSIFETLAHEEFDFIINLEKDIGICAFVSQLKAKKRFGFYFHPKKHDIETYKLSTQYLLSGQENHKNIDRNALEILYEAVDQEWQGQGAILHRLRRPTIKYDIGFNYEVGTKWPTKAWPKERWQELHGLLSNKYAVTWQQGHKNLNKYIDWIDSCRLIVTSDSLGQVIAQALGKQVISLFGATNPRRMQGIKNTHVVAAHSDCPHMPCYLHICRFDKFCMSEIKAPEVAQLCENLLHKEELTVSARV